MARDDLRYRSRYEDQWPAYVPVAERRRRAEQEMAKLARKGQTISPVKIEGRVIATTFWGKAWCENLESYQDFANRIERGRTYVRNGSVVDLRIAPHEVKATVSGSALYQVKIAIDQVAKPQWRSICADCAGGIDSLVELLQGQFSKGVMERICRQGSGLFPKPSEIRFSCSCPDYAYMCKHIAAVLYGIGARFDRQPELLFRLRAVDENDLVARIGDALPLSKQAPAAGKLLQSDDMAALFGIDIAGEAPIGEAQAKGKAAKPAVKAAPRSPQPGKPRRTAAKLPPAKKPAAKAPAAKAPAAKLPAAKLPAAKPRGRAQAASR